MGYQQILEQLVIDFFWGQREVYSIVKLLLTFWKVKSGKGGFNGRRPDAAVKAAKAATAAKAAATGQATKTAEKTAQTATAEQTAGKAIPFWKVKSGNGGVFQRPAAQEQQQNQQQKQQERQ